MLDLLKEFFAAFGFFIIVGGMSLIPVSLIVLFNYKKIKKYLLDKVTDDFVSRIK